MHNYIKGNKVNKHQFGGSFANLLPLLQGIGKKFPKGGTGNMPMGAPTEGEDWNAKLGQGLTGALSGALAFNDINNSGMNGTQKTMARADAGVDALSSVASLIPGVGGVVGGLLGGLNKLGGALIKDPKEVKNYVANDAVASSSSFGSITAGMGDVANSIGTYKGSGLVGKLFGRNKLKNNINMSNTMQSLASGLIEDNKLFKDRATSSSDLFGTRNMNNLYNSDKWGSGAVQYGQTGTKLMNGLLPKTNRAQSVAKGYLATYGANPIVVDPMDEVLSSPQKSLMWGLTGKYQTPSQGLNITNPTAKTVVDFVADPLNVLAFSKLGKLGKLGREAEALTTGVQLTKNERLLKLQQLIQKRAAAALKSKAANGKVALAADKSLDLEANLLSNTPTYKDGGAINVIVDGKLHAHKHDLKAIDEFKDAEITNKGVAVIAYSEGGDLTQCAEVERDELILHIGLTKKMEMLAEEGTEEAMIQAGRILAKELVKNTRDSKGKILHNG